MSFLSPEFLIGLAVVPALAAVYVWFLRRRRPAAVRYSSLALVHAAMPRSSRLRRHLPFVLFALGLAGLAIGLARPAAIVAVPSGQATVILAIDVSRSMCSTDIEPSRLEVAQAAAAAFIERQGSDRQIGIVAFAGFGEVVQAPTPDQEVLLDAVRTLTTGRRTAIGSAILESIDAIAEVDPSVPRSITDATPGDPPPPRPRGAYVPHIIIVLTDGANNAGPEPVEAAQQAADRGVRVYTIGFGTENPGNSFGRCRPNLVGNEPFGGFGGGGFGGGGGGFRRGIDEETLKEVAEVTDGEYYSAESAGELHAVFEALPTYLNLKHEIVEITVFFAAIGVLLAGLAILLAQTWRPLP
jgi:Ca-activated chloride channel family protein